MNQEYLFTTSEKKYEISKIEMTNVETKVVDLTQGESWILRCTTELKNEQGAEALSKIEATILKYNPIIIKTDTSDYYLKKLYPLANEFERKLRKFLYLTNEISPKDKKSDNIKNLEAKDFGELFDVLFTDKGFIENSKRVASKLPPNYTKKQLLEKLEDMEESCLWDKLVKPKVVQTLRKEFEQIRIFRNDIMHSHNIDTNTFKEAEKLFRTVIKELDSANETIVKPESISSVANEDFSEVLKNALSAKSEYDIAVSAKPYYISTTDSISKIATDSLIDKSLYASIPLHNHTLEPTSIKLKSSVYEPLSMVDASHLVDENQFKILFNNKALSNKDILIGGKDNGQVKDADGK